LDAIARTAKMITDLVQILLNHSGAWKFFSCALIFCACWLMWRYFRALVLLLFKICEEIKKPFIPVSWGSLFIILIGSGFISLFSNEISDGLEWVEQKYLDPTCISSDTSSFAVKCYETELSKNLSGEQMQILVKWTDQIAKDCGTNRLALYEVYNSECALNPFAFNEKKIYDKKGRLIRIDTVAAGVIQFTPVGISGFGVTFRQVKDACLKKDLEFLMTLAHKYMVHWSKGYALPTAANVYTAVFMPSFVGGDMNTVLASLRSSRPDYYLENINLDGHYLDGDKIMTSKKARDGKITIYDLHLHLELKKAQLLKKYETGKN
jgi:hypothetical protein